MTKKQELFILEYQKDRNATQAAKRAGYSEKTAYSIGQRLLKNPEIQKVLEADKNARAERVKFSADDVIQDLIRIKDSCLNGKKVDFKNALRALELIGKNLGMFTNKLQVQEDNKVEYIFKWQEREKSSEPVEKS